MITAIEVDSLNRVRVKDEAGLIAGTRAGDTSCFEALTSRYERRIYRLARTVVKNESDAEEIAQEAFFKAFEHIEGFKSDSRFMGKNTGSAAVLPYVFAERAMPQARPERVSVQ
jgi:sigma-70-like protein